MDNKAELNKTGPVNRFVDKEIESCIFFVGVIFTGNEKALRDSLNSVFKQKKSNTKVSVHIFSSSKYSLPSLVNELLLSAVIFKNNKEFFKVFSETVSGCNADYCTLLWSGEEFFEDAFKAAASIFGQYNDINWLTGIQAYATQDGFNISLGSTAIRRWSYKIYERNLYKNSGRFIPPASTFWRKKIWTELSPALHFVGQRDFCEDLWLAFFNTQRLYTCKIYFSSSDNAAKLNRKAFKQPNNPALIEDSWIGKLKEFFFINNVPYLRVFYKAEGGFAPVIRFDHNTQAYFLSEY